MTPYIDVTPQQIALFAFVWLMALAWLLSFNRSGR